MFGRNKLACSFCGKGEAEVTKLVAGPKVFICDQCVSVASKIMQQGSGNQPLSPQPRRSLLRKVLKAISRRASSDIHRFAECGSMTS